MKMPEDVISVSTVLGIISIIGGTQKINSRSMKEHMLSWTQYLSSSTRQEKNIG